MKECPSCHNKCEDISRFCNNCGYDFSTIPICPYCQTRNPYGFRQCSKCGLFVDGNYSYEQIDDAVWDAFRGSAIGREHYRRLFKYGLHLVEINAIERDEQRKTTCPYCLTHNKYGFKYCSSCGLAVDGAYSEKQIDDAVWEVMKVDAAKREHYKSLFPNGLHLQEIRLIEENEKKEKKEIASKQRKETIFNVRKTISSVVYVLALIVVVLFLIIGEDAYKLLGIPSATPIAIIARWIDPDIKSF